MDKKVNVLAIATCFNRCQITKKSIESLICNNPKINFTFVIVDDNSSDGTKEMLSQYQCVNIIEGNGELFYSGGMRKGIEAAKRHKEIFDYCMLFNDDVSFFDYAIERMIAVFPFQEADIIIGATCDRNGKVTYAGVSKDSWFVPRCRLIFSDKEELMPCETFNANCVLIKYPVFMKLDNIDPVYTHNMGDFDYGFQAHRQGYKLYVSNFFVGICEKTTTEGSWRDRTLSRKERLKIKNINKGTPNKAWFHYLKKNYNLMTAVVYSITPYVRILMGI